MKRQSPLQIFLLVVAVLSICGFLATLYVGLTIDQSKLPTVQVGKQAADFEVAYVSGANSHYASPTPRFRLSDFAGQPVIVNFWASWCVSCRTEAHDFQAFHKGQTEVVVLGIAIQDELEAAQGFARRYGKTYLLGLDEDGSAAIDYGVTGVPETFFIDRSGTIVHKETGPITAQILAEQAKRLF